MAKPTERLDLFIKEELNKKSEKLLKISNNLYGGIKGVLEDVSILAGIMKEICDIVGKPEKVERKGD